jgi:hypothetical protein
MLKKLPVQPQLEMFKTVLTSFIHPEHELCLLAKKIDWKSLEDEFAPLYGKVGRPSIPISTREGLISHLKHDHRMIRNYLSGTAGDQINTLLAAAAYNMKKWMRLKRQEILDYIFSWFSLALILVPVNIQR